MRRAKTFRPVSATRAARFLLWVQTAPEIDLRATYELARRFGNRYQMRCIVEEFRRREPQTK